MGDGTAAETKWWPVATLAAARPAGRTTKPLYFVVSRNKSKQRKKRRLTVAGRLATYENRLEARSAVVPRPANREKAGSRGMKSKQRRGESRATGKRVSDPLRSSVAGQCSSTGNGTSTGLLRGGEGLAAPRSTGKERE
uniref:Uncharacterized protein n=1 Tax=Opuntia streptacantha TaxID=393608 RepID=A0A7C9AV25_OPUST